MLEQPKKFEAASASITDEQKAKLKALFPEIITEGGKIDFDRLKLTLGETVDAGKERYGMNWPGKADCFKTIQQPSMATLVPARDESVNFDTTDNLIIEGDNLETLKLLQKAYLGKVKMIYIDPPYNTGNDFIYPDNYSESLETYLRYTGQVDNEGRKFSTNAETDGRFHSKWLNMMLPRLFLARNLLRDDGVMFISIDDHEADNMRKICDEIFGEENFVSQIVWEKKFSPQNDDKHLTAVHDFIFLYARNKEIWRPFLLQRSEEQIASFKNPDNDKKGAWTSGDLTSKTKAKGHSYPITSPTGKVHYPPAGRQWAPSHETFDRMLKEGRIWFGADGNNFPRCKQYLSEVQNGIVPMTIWHHEDVGHNQEAKQELNEIFNREIDFETPKPVRLVERMLDISVSQANGDVVLDFFAGSGATGHAVMEKNKNDGGNRKFILVQLPEQVSVESPTYKSGYKTIADITKERIRRAIKQLNESDGKQLDLSKSPKQDRGFKVFKLQSSNFKAWNAEQPKDDAELGKQLTLHVDHLVSGRTQDDVLYELLLKSGFPLDTKVEKTPLAGKVVFSIADGAMLICLEKELTPEVIKAMAEKKPERVVCLDAGFANNDQLKTNAVQTMKAKGVTKFQTV